MDMEIAKLAKKYMNIYDIDFNHAYRMAYRLVKRKKRFKK
jgi:hypothetical protein